MTVDAILAQAIEHVPALLLIWLTIYLGYWVMGVARWPRRDALIERWGTLEVGALGGFSVRSLALISLISLFMELLLIRWIASEIRIFAYFTSLVLIACFLGFGLGCYLARRRVVLAYTLAPLLVMVWLVELPWEPLRRLVSNLSGFISIFQKVGFQASAFGSNLLESLSFVLGIKTLVIVAGLLYLLSFLSMSHVTVEASLPGEVAPSLE